MDQYGEQIAAVLATLPQPSAQRSAQASSAPQPSAPTPAALPPAHPAAPYVPPPIPPTTRAEPRVRAAAPKRSRLPLLVALGIVVLGGGGAAAYFATRPHHDPAATTATPRPAVDPWNVATPPPDPWSTGTLPAALEIGTAETPIPPGFRLTLPSDWQELKPDEKSIGYLDEKRNVLVAAAPLFPGTNDPKELAKQWESMTGAKLQRISTVFSAGVARDELEFTATVDGVEVGQVWVLYITPAYRVGVIYQAPGTLFTDEAFIAELNRFYASNVSVP
jgi:hypothetical protein